MPTRFSPTHLLLPACALGVGFWAACGMRVNEPEAMHFFRGNTHTHTLWSDGDASPDWVTAWYREQDFNFLVLSEHNIVADHERWFAIGDGRLTRERLADLQVKFGADAVEVRETAEGGQEMRLPTLQELRARFETPGEFLMITGEEVTDGFEGKNVHINALNTYSVIDPQHGTTLGETIKRNLEAIAIHGIEHDQQVFAHLNHPNFTWSMTPEDLAGVSTLRSFEVYNGHPSVNNRGDSNHPSTEAMWDFVNHAAAREGQKLLLGIATDDAHHYHDIRLGKSNPGRGWIQVAALELQPEAVVEAIEAGAFYGSSGVELHSFDRNQENYRVQVIPEEGVSYRIQFFGARVGESPKLLEEVIGTKASYTVTKQDLFVRAKVVSDQPHPNPAQEGETECAWLQPIAGPAATRTP